MKMAMDAEDIIKKAIKNTKDPMQSLDDGIEIVDDGSIPKQKQRKRSGKYRQLKDWIPADFVSFASRVYRKRYSRNWDLNFSACCQDIQFLHDSLLESLGFVDNLVVRDYIEYYFENFADHKMRLDGKFYFDSMRKERPLRSFASNYDYDKSLKKYISPSNSRPTIAKIKSKRNISNSVIDDAYTIGDEVLVLEFGIIIPINWLVYNKGLSIQKATKRVHDVSKKIHQNGAFNQVVSVTKKMAPYPSWLKFKQIDRFISIIDKKMRIHVEFNDDSEDFNFLSN